MGARFQENIYFTETATSKEISSVKSSANANSFDTSVKGGYKGFSGSVSVGRDADSSKSSSNSSSNSKSSSTSAGGMRQFGQIKASGKCGELLGDENILFPIEYDSKPIYSILRSSKYALAKKTLESYINQGLRAKGTECIKKQCNSAGVCVVNPAFFEQPLEKGMPYTDLFK